MKFAHVLGILLASFVCVFSQGISFQFYNNDIWMDRLNPAAPFFNPAQIASVEYQTLSATVSPVSIGSATLSSTSYVLPLSKKQTLALAVAAEVGNSVENSSFLTSSTLATASRSFSSNSNYVGNISYAFSPTPSVRAAVSIAPLFQTAFGNGTYTFSADAGIESTVLDHSAVGIHSVGLAVSAISLTPGLSNTLRPSTRLRFHWNAGLFDGGLTTRLWGDISDLFSPEEVWDDAPATIGRGGIDLDAVLYKMYTVSSSVMLTKSQKPLVALGAGIDLAQYNDKKALHGFYSLAYQGSAISSFIHTFGIRYQFGKNRNVQFYKSPSHVLELKASKLYNDAMQQYYDKQYFEAFITFSRLVTLYPTFQKNDWAHYYRGRCFEHLHIWNHATDILLYARRHYPKSPMLSYAELALMRLHYKRGNNSEAFIHFRNLNTKQTPDSLRLHGFYLAGQMYLNQKEYSSALRSFSVITPRHPIYPFALHSSAIAHYLQGEDDKALAAFETIQRYKPQNPEAEEIVYRSALLHGFLHYENKRYRSAMQALRTIPTQSMYFEESLLGIAWTALQSGKFYDCALASKRLTSYSDQPIMKAESQLLLSYVFIQQQKYEKAISHLERARGYMSGLVNQRERTVAHQNFKQDRVALESVGYSADSLSKLDDEQFDNLSLYDLKYPVDQYQQKLAYFFKTDYQLSRALLFQRSADQVRSDIEFALAKATELKNKPHSAQSYKKQQQLDSEINRIEKMLQELEDE